MIFQRKKILSIFIGILCIVSSVSAQNLEFESVERRDGTAFFAIDKSSGQISYMLDYGSEAGVWRNYGNAIRESGEDNLMFYTLERNEGTAFFALESITGQVFFMMDYGSDAGNWKKYGNTLPAEGYYEFQAATRPDGTVFFAMDGETGQVYFMVDYGSNAGNWEKYGGVLPE